MANWVDLTETPPSLEGQDHRLVRVKGDESGLELARLVDIWEDLTFAGSGLWVAGLDANKPELHVEGRYWFSSDEKIGWYDTGAAWIHASIVAHIDLDGMTVDDHHARDHGSSVHSGAIGDAGAVTFTPSTLTDWDGDAGPGDLDDALNQLAERVDDFEVMTTQGDLMRAGASGVPERVGIGTAGTVLISDGTDADWGLALTGDYTLTGTLDIVHTAAENDEHALEIDVIAGGFADIKALAIRHTTGALAAGEDDAAVVVEVDEDAASGGRFTGFEVLTTTTGGVKVEALFAGVGVAPIEQLSGTFENPDLAEVEGVDKLTDLTNPATNVNIFEADTDVMIIGNTAKFEEIECILSTASSGAGIKPKFDFSDGAAPTWAEFSPTDGTNAMRNTGIIAWEDTDISDVGTWTQSGGNYLIRITRQRSTLSVEPVCSFLQIAAAVEYGWDKDALLTINKLSQLTTRGDLLRAGDSAVLERVAIGTAGEIFKSNGTDATWVDDDYFIEFIIDGGGSAITTGEKGHVEVPASGVIEGWTILADQSGSIVVDVWLEQYADFPPTVADTIAGSELPTLSTAVKNQDLALGTWTTTVTQGDIIAFNVDSITTVERVLVSLRIRKT